MVTFEVDGVESSLVGDSLELVSKTHAAEVNSALVRDDVTMTVTIIIHHHHP